MRPIAARIRVFMDVTSVFRYLVKERIEYLQKKLDKNHGCPYMTKLNYEHNLEFWKKLTGKDYDKTKDYATFKERA